MVRFRFLIKVVNFFFKCLFLYFIFVFTMISNCVALKCNKHILLLLEKNYENKTKAITFYVYNYKIGKKIVNVT